MRTVRIIPASLMSHLEALSTRRLVCRQQPNCMQQVASTDAQLLLTVRRVLHSHLFLTHLDEVKYKPILQHSKGAEGVGDYAVSILYGGLQVSTSCVCQTQTLSAGSVNASPIWYVMWQSDETVFRVELLICTTGHALHDLELSHDLLPDV